MYDICCNPDDLRQLADLFDQAGTDLDAQLAALRSKTQPRQSMFGWAPGYGVALGNYLQKQRETEQGHEQLIDEHRLIAAGLRRDAATFEGGEGVP